MYSPHTVTLVNVIRTQKDDYTEDKSYNVTQLENVLLDVTKSSAPGNTGASRSVSASMYVPQSVRIPNGATYVEPAEYSGARRTWTLRPCGDSAQVDCYVIKGHFCSKDLDYKTLKESGAQVYAVTSVRFCDYGSYDMWHWEAELR